MKTSLAPLALASLAVGLLAGCRGATDDSNLMQYAESVGTLYVVPDVDGHLVAGVVQYRIYENGSVRYSGDLTYTLHPGTSFTMQVPYDGQMSLQPQSVLSASYKQAGSSWTENKVVLAVDTVTPSGAAVSSKVIDPVNCDSPDATGQFRVDTSGKVIGIQAAEVTGTVFAGTPAAMKLHLRLASTPPPSH
jgi:hypothetical protein